MEICKKTTNPRPRFSKYIQECGSGCSTAPFPRGTVVSEPQLSGIPPALQSHLERLGLGLSAFEFPRLLALVSHLGNRDTALPIQCCLQTSPCGLHSLVRIRGAAGGGQWLRTSICWQQDDRVGACLDSFSGIFQHS